MNPHEPAVLPGSDSGPGGPRIAVLHLGRNGGGPKFTLALATALAERASVVSVVAATADNRTEYDRLGPVLSLRTFDTKVGAALRAPVMLPHAIRLRRFLRKHDIQAVVVSMEQIWQAPILAVARSRRRRVLLCVHDASMHPGQANRVEEWTLHAHRILADGLMTFSAHVASTLEATSRFDPSRIWQTVHASYGSGKGVPRSLPSSDHVPTIGFLGRLSAYKGLGLAYDSITALRESGRQVRFHVAGDGQDPALSRMTHPDDRLDIRWLEDAHIPAVLDSLDVLLLPYVEASQSGVFAYAMGRGVPMVVTPVGGLREQALDTGAAAIADDLTPAAVARALSALLDDPARYRRLSEAAIAASRDSYSWGRTAFDVLDAVQQLDDLPVRGARAHGRLG